MDKATEQLLRDLAKSLGVATEKLIEWYTLHSVAQGLADIFTGVVTALICILAGLWSRRLWNTMATDDTRDGELEAFFCTVSLGAALVTFVASLIFIRDGFISLYAPQAQAITNLIGALKK